MTKIDEIRELTDSARQSLNGMMSDQANIRLMRQFSLVERALAHTQHLLTQHDAAQRENERLAKVMTTEGEITLQVNMALKAENTALKEEIKQLKTMYDRRGQYIDKLEEHSAALTERVRVLEGNFYRLGMFVAAQAEDEGLWAIPIPFNSQPIMEAYLQQELRRLHTVIEEMVNAELEAARETSDAEDD